MTHVDQWAEPDWLCALRYLPNSLLKYAACGDTCSAQFTCKESPCPGQAMGRWCKLWAVGVSYGPLVHAMGRWCKQWAVGVSNCDNNVSNDA